MLQLYPLLLLLFVSRRGFCGETDVKWKDSCKKLGQNVQNMLTELDQIPNSICAEEIIEKINKLNHFTMALAQCIRTADKHILFAPLIMEHAQKIGQFCHNLLIGEDVSTFLNSDWIKERLRHGIGQPKERAVQMRQLMDTVFIDWEVWPILYNFELFADDSPNGVDTLVDQLGHKLARMRKLLAQCGSYYNGTAFDEALRQLMMVALSEGDSQVKKLGQLWRIVPKLMVNATLELLDNLMEDLFEQTSSFYGMKFLALFANEINVADKICAGILRRSTLTRVDHLLISDQFEQQRDRANALFMNRMKAIREQIKSIGARLKDGIAGLQIEKDSSIKREQLINALQKVQNLFAIIYNELAMIDLTGPGTMLGEQLDKLKNIIVTMRHDGDAKRGNGEGGGVDGMPNSDDGDSVNDDDNVQLTDEIVSCLNVETIVQRIEQERGNLAYKILF